NRDVTHTLQPAGVDPLGHHSAVRAARRVGRLDHHPAPALGPVAGLDDAVVGQVEDRARSITLRARRLVHRLVVLCLVDVSTTHITAGPRALTHLRRAGHFHHEPRRASNQHRRDALAPWLHTYNTERRHSALGGLPPISRVSPT